MSHRPNEYIRRGWAPKDQGSAFTLVELLVVIGIIAILISLLLPALQAARRQAQQVTCAAHMRQMGQAAQLYVNDNKGYFPPARAGYYKFSAASGQGIYNVNGVKFGDTAYGPGSDINAAYWFNFLAKYLFSGSGGAGDGRAGEDLFTKSVLWGCPAYERFPALESANQAFGLEWQPSYNGFSWNPHATFSPTNPPIGTSRPDETNIGNNNVNNGDGNWGTSKFRCIGVVSNNNFGASPSTDGTPPYVGHWYKMTDYKQPAQRVMIADSTFLWLDANAVAAASNPANLNVVQKVAYPPAQSQEFATAGNTTGMSTTGQTTFDWYRHGRRPPLAKGGATGYYSAFGGKVSYNILYCDGHVGEEITKEASYRAMRQRWPEKP